ncbi:hypothetical protein HH310_19395 [Actinoplanes sp. TBRC 11911]|uniref:hypothetical protein n=1 Tax=Actinoplanes sp. TBRC 11911 TaxID=2729386 RepID=UPI00145EFD13|nr:hypothetical protein [Actinoplanes sp. TBRC 11911]NMO53344.1 hypothetical protein [Actinoplanes sp. TBRC 11911]
MALAGKSWRRIAVTITTAAVMASIGATPAFAGTEGTWEPVGTPSTVTSHDSPAMVNFGGSQWMLAYKSSTDTQIWASLNNGSPVAIPGARSNFAPAIALLRGAPTIVFTGTDSKIYWAEYNLVTGQWGSARTQFPDQVRTFTSPSVMTTRDGTLHVAYVDSVNHGVSTFSFDGQGIFAYDGQDPPGVVTDSAPSIAPLPPQEYGPQAEAEAVIAIRGTDNRIYSLVQHQTGPWQWFPADGWTPLGEFQSNFGPRIASSGDELRVAIRTQDNVLAYIGPERYEVDENGDTLIVWGNWGRDNQNWTLYVIPTLVGWFDDSIRAEIFDGPNEWHAYQKTLR